MLTGVAVLIFDMMTAYFIYHLPLKQVMLEKLFPCFRAHWSLIFFFSKFICCCPWSTHICTRDSSFCSISFSIFISSLQWDPRTVCWRSRTDLLFLQSSVTLLHLNRRCLRSTSPPWSPPTRPATSFHPPTGLWEAP